MAMKKLKVTVYDHNNDFGFVFFCKRSLIAWDVILFLSTSHHIYFSFFHSLYSLLSFYFLHKIQNSFYFQLEINLTINVSCSTQKITIKKIFFLFPKIMQFGWHSYSCNVIIKLKLSCRGNWYLPIINKIIIRMRIEYL